MTIPPFGDNISNITDANTFRVWFDATNSLIQKLNPLEIYGITAGVGEVAGITLDINRATGAAVIGLDLPLHITGPHKFGGGISFENEVRFKGLTVDAHGATFFGNLVRSFNGQTGDITAALTGVGLPGDIENGDILIFSPNGSTLAAYSLFTGGTFENNDAFRFGASGGMLLGTGGSTYGFIEQQKGNVQIFGVTGAQISLHDLSFDPTSEPESGAHMFFGRIGRGNNDPMGFVYTGGKTSGFESNANAPYIVIQHSDRKIGLLGITNPSSPIDYKSRSQTNVKDVDIRFTDSLGVTSGLRVYQNGFVKSNEGIFTETNPKNKGLRSKKSIRILANNNNVAVDLDHTSENTKSNFTVFGQESSGASLSPVINARNTGDVVIGGLTASDSGSDFGSLNIVSGKLLVGGTLGNQSGNGVQVLTSSGISTGYKIIFPDTLVSSDPLIGSLFSNFSYDDFLTSGFAGQSTNTGVHTGKNADNPDGTLYAGRGGLGGIATNKTITRSITGTDFAQFVRLADPNATDPNDPNTSRGITYAPINHDGVDYAGDTTSTSVLNNPNVLTEYGNKITGRGGDPYNKIICLKDDDDNNLVGDFTITVQLPPADIDGEDNSWDKGLRQILGIAVFVDMPDNVLAELNLGASAFTLDNSGLNFGSDTPTVANPVCFDGTSAAEVGNPLGNLLRPDLGVQFMEPFGGFGPNDPAYACFRMIDRGGLRLPASNVIPQTTFTFSGTALRRVQILMFSSLDKRMQTFANVNFPTSIVDEGFNPFGGLGQNVTNVNGIFFRSGGVLTATFNSVEV